MADIAPGNATDGGNNAGVTNTLSFSHTNNGDTVVVGFNGDNIGGADDISSVTYAGAACTLGKKITAATGGDRITYEYYITSAAAGANTVVITAGSTHLLQGGALSLSNVDQASPVDGTPQSSFSAQGATSETTNFTTAADRSMAVLVEGCYSAGTAPVAGTGSTRQTFDATNGGWGIFTSPVLTPAGAASMQTTRGSNPFNLAILHVVVMYKNAGGAAGPTLPQLERGIRGMARGLVMGGAS